MSMTENAAKRLKFLVHNKNDPDVLGIRLGVRRRGCNGLSYTMDYAISSEIHKFDEVVEDKGAQCHSPASNACLSWPQATIFGTFATLPPRCGSLYAL